MKWPTLLQALHVYFAAGMRSLVSALNLHTSCKCLGQSSLFVDHDHETVSLELALLFHWEVAYVFPVIVASYCSFDLGYFCQSHFEAWCLVCSLVFFVSLSF